METLKKRRWYRKLCCFYKVYKCHSLKYLFNIIPVTVSRCNTRNTNNILQFKVKCNFFWNSFFPFAVIEWKKLNLNIRNSESLNVFKNSLVKFICPSGNSVFNCHNPRGVILLTTLRLGLSHLREHKSNMVFKIGNDIETLAHFLLHCPHYSNERSTILITIRNINRHIFDKNDLQITETLLYGDSSLDNKRNTYIKCHHRFPFCHKEIRC